MNVAESEELASTLLTGRADPLTRRASVSGNLALFKAPSRQQLAERCGLAGCHAEQGKWLLQAAGGVTGDVSDTARRLRGGSRPCVYPLFGGGAFVSRDGDFGKKVAEGALWRIGSAERSFTVRRLARFPRLLDPP
jgi:hypothetical protein